MAANRLVVFDFDGVIADSREVIFAIVNALIAQRGMPSLSRQQLRHAPTGDLLRQLKIRFWQIPSLVKRARQMMLAQQDRVGLHPEVVAALSFVATCSCEFIVVSSNQKILIEAFFERYLPHLPPSHIVGDVSLFGKHRALRTLLRARKVQASQCVYVGDEVRDVQAANKTGIPSIAVCWGKDAYDALQAAKPTYLVKDGPALLGALQALETR